MRKRLLLQHQLKLGYTLLELMIVLAILVSIMAVSWPRIARRMQLLGPTEAALQVKADLAEARERSVSSGQAWALRIERGSSNYEFGPVADFREQILKTSTPTTGEESVLAPTLARPAAEVNPESTSLTPVVPATGLTAGIPTVRIQRSELPAGIVFDDGFAHSASDANAIRLDVAPNASAPITTTPTIQPQPIDNWKFAVVFQPDGRATESEILLKEQTTENKIRLRIRGFTGGVTIDRLERKSLQTLLPNDLENTGLPESETLTSPPQDRSTSTINPASQPTMTEQVPR